MSRATASVAALLCLSLPALAGCATLRERQEAGGTRYWPTAARWKSAASGALKDPHTWAPAAGAALVAATGWDDNLSSWATRRTPIFWSPHGARDVSDTLRDWSEYALYATGVAAPGRKAAWGSRVERLLLQYLGDEATSRVTMTLKKATDRERPDHSDRLSFPSGHSSEAFYRVGMARRNVDATRLPEGAKLGIKIGLDALAVGTAWARVEGGVHYPADVMAGAVLGNFMALFLNDAFLAPGAPVAIRARVGPGDLFLGMELSY